MRPGQQNRRSRNRGNSGGGRKGPNPLSRNYESNGPDVKVRGNAQHIADKYTQLARDSSSSGDRVMAENYLQHAEHYNRIIAAAQAQLGVQQQRERDDEDGGDDGDDVDTTVTANGHDGQDGNDGNDGDTSSDPQPVLEGTPAEVAIEESEIRSAGNRGEQVRREPRNRNRRPADGEGNREQRRPVDADGNVAGGQRERRPARTEPRAEAEGNEESPADGSAIGWLAAANQD